MKKLILFLSFLFVVSCTKDPIIYTLITSANPAEGGTVSPSTQQYDEGETASITATASSEYVFQSWSGATGSSNSTSVVMNSDKSVTANFVKKKYSLNVMVEGEGTVNEKVIKAGVATDYNSGTIVELTAVPSEEWLFLEWTGDITGTENPTQITIDKAKNVTAMFVKKQYPLKIEIEGEGTVTEKVIKAGVATDYKSGTIVELTAEPTGEWEFVEWTGDITSTENPVQITIDDAKTVKVKFMRYFDYKVPSHDWENNTPWISVYEKIFESGFEKHHWISHANTFWGIADFNFDGFLDINLGIPENDELPIDFSLFILNDGNDSYYLDNNFPYESTGEVLGSRKTIVGDFNGDNKPDVFRPAGAHDNLSYPHIIMSDENKYKQKIVDEAPLLQPHTISSGDIDNDGDLDVFLSQAGEQDGFLINDGNANFQWKWISEIIEDFDSGHLYPNNKYGYYGFWSSEMTDVDKDGYVDLILGGSYKDEPYDSNLDGPAVFWGDGSGKFYLNNSTTLFISKDIDYANGRTISLSHDYAINDVDGDGINDIAIFSECSSQDENNYWLYHFIKGTGNRNFIDKTKEWLPENNIKNSINHVWIKLMDVDNNGKIDLVESEPKIWLYTSQWRNSLRWEWNGSKFEKKN